MALSSFRRFSYFLRLHHHHHSLFLPSSSCRFVSLLSTPSSSLTCMLYNYKDIVKDQSRSLATVNNDTERVLPVDLHEDMTGSYITYTISRALPDVRDGLKPVERRILLQVGMSTNIPPHNLGELVDALCVLIHNPEATLQELLEYMPGPDFPTGGLIMGNLGILEAYRTGRGHIIVRGKTDVELLDSKTKRMAVIITEIPYQTNKSSLVEEIAELVENKSLAGISDIWDRSDHSGMYSGMRIVIELKRGADPSIVVNNLYRLTSLQSVFSCNMVGILDGQPKQMGLKEILQAFIDFRCSVIERRARFELSQLQERRHFVEGIMVVLDNSHGVFRMLMEDSSNASVADALKNKFKISDKQAKAILNMLERKKLGDESKTLTEEILKLEELLSSKKNILQLIEQEAIELKNQYPSPRRSLLEDSDGQLGTTLT